MLATNALDDGVSASPAIAGDEIFVRSNRYLYALGAAAEKTADTGG